MESQNIRRILPLSVAGVLGFEPRNGGIKILMRTEAMRMTTKTKAATQDCRRAGLCAGFIPGCNETGAHQ